jgi:hypothetical protein
LFKKLANSTTNKTNLHQWGAASPENFMPVLFVFIREIRGSNDQSLDIRAGRASTFSGRSFFRPQSSVSQPELCPLAPALRGNRQGGMGVPPVLALVDASNGIVCFPCSAIFWAESKKRMPPFGGIRFGIFTGLSWLSPFQRE